MNHPLAFRDDGSFTIVQFTDLHWHDGTGLDVRTASLMEMVLDAECPDLVVLTGDVLEGSECPDAAAAWRQAVEPMERRSIPWAAVFGNHDDEGSLGRHQLMVVQRACRMCLTESGPPSLPGVGNFVLDVRSSHPTVDPKSPRAFISWTRSATRRTATGTQRSRSHKSNGFASRHDTE